MASSPGDLRLLQTFLVQLGAALNAVGEPVYTIQQRLTRIAAAHGVHGARISAFPTSLLVTLGGGESATLELTTPLASSTRLDQISALHRLADEAERGEVTPEDGLRRLDGIRELAPRFGALASIAGYVVLTVGICLILHPAPRDVACAAVFGAIVGALRLVTRNEPTLQILLPVVAAFCVAALTALAVKHDLTDPGLRAMIAALVVFLPGAALTTAVLELAAGDMIAGSSRLVWAGVQLLLLAFGIIAGIEAAGIPSTKAFSSHDELLGDWAPWLGVLVFALGVLVAHSVPPNTFWSLLLVLYAAWVGQVVGNHLVGGYASGLIGALVMTPVAALVSRLPSSMPVYATFLPGFWLLVPGAMSLIGLTELAGNASVVGSQDFLAAVGSILAVALGVLCGTQLEEWIDVGARRFPRRRSGARA
ncbi:MAG TPA: threonine/serine exporter family protein [Gaiellaceae bacterium]|jgi:uncharacterized membrane protein YjjP (DUF1212 family)